MNFYWLFIANGYKTFKRFLFIMYKVVRFFGSEQIWITHVDTMAMIIYFLRY
jgi:hypothetical protein